MKVPARFLLAILAISIASLTPTVPGQSLPVASPHKYCHVDMSANGCHGCPINSGASNSLSGSTCCTGPAACLLLYLNDGNSFAAQMHMIGTIAATGDRVTIRSNRPPVPPPRSDLS